MIALPDIPTDPGCYQYRDAHGTIIYIGKAKNLKKRVASYFQKRPLDAKTQQLVSQIATVDFFVTTNELEALILESNLIKRYQPKYNIDLKDAKSYAYIQLTNDAFPRIQIARRPSGGGSVYGPFVSARERDYVLAALKRAFRLRTCRKLPKRACLRYHMGSCSGPCIGAIGPEEYEKDVRKAESILRGRSKELLETLQEEMATCSAHQEFEQALQIRDQIRAIQQFPERQHVERQKAYDEDVINYVVHGEKVHLIVFSVYRGTLGEKEEFTFEHSEGFLEEFITQYYADRTPPKELILPVEVEPSVAEFLAHRLGQQVRITVPQKGDKKALLDLVARNIEIAFFGDRLKLEALRRSLRLPEVPSVIECFDISHLSGTSTVGSMVQFRNGKPSKKNYRRFRILTVEGIDDVAAIGEVVRRRYGRLAEERGDLPDLVVVDGGKGQLGAAVAEIRGLGLAVPVIAIAKRDEEVYVPGYPGPLPLAKKDTASLFIQEIRDEAHRFAVAYHRLLRRKKMVEA